MYRRRAQQVRRRLNQPWYRARLPDSVQAIVGTIGVAPSPGSTAAPAEQEMRLSTIHDLAFLVCPTHATPVPWAYLSAVVPGLVTEARVLNGAETTKRDLIERLRVPKGGRRGGAERGRGAGWEGSDAMAAASRR